MLHVTFFEEGNIIHDTVNNLLIEGVVKAVILYNSAFVHMRFFTCKQVQNDNPSVSMADSSLCTREP